MNERINELKQRPVLSVGSANFLKNFSGGIIPDDIRQELERYVRDIQPFIDRNEKEMIEHFHSVFKK